MQYEIPLQKSSQETVVEFVNVEKSIDVKEIKSNERADSLS